MSKQKLLSDHHHKRHQRVLMRWLNMLICLIFRNSICFQRRCSAKLQRLGYLNAKRTCGHLGSQIHKNLTLLVLTLDYFGINRSIPWLPMPWLLTSPGHQQLWYWQCRINIFLSSEVRLPRPASSQCSRNDRTDKNWKYFVFDTSLNKFWATRVEYIMNDILRTLHFSQATPLILTWSPCGTPRQGWRRFDAPSPWCRPVLTRKFACQVGRLANLRVVSQIVTRWHYE